MIKSRIFLQTETRFANLWTEVIFSDKLKKENIKISWRGLKTSFLKRIKLFCGILFGLTGFFMSKEKTIPTNSSRRFNFNMQSVSKLKV